MLPSQRASSEPLWPRSTPILAEVQGRTFEGYFSRITFEETTVVIKHRSVALATRLSSGARIGCQHISGARVCEPTVLKNGWLQFLVDGEPGAPIGKGSPPSGAAVVLFTGTGRHKRDLADLVLLLNAIASANKAPVLPGVHQARSATQRSAAERLAELDALRDGDLLSDAEHAAKHTAILEEI